MHLLVVSHKVCWPSPQSPTGYATDGGFPFQMRALSELFESTTLMLPCASTGQTEGEVPLQGAGLSVRPLSMPRGTGLARKLGMAAWLLRAGPALAGAVRRADAVHTPIPSDVGTIAMLAAYVLGKPLFVRHCGNWGSPATWAEHFWKWFMVRAAGGRNVMLATGGATAPPSSANPAIRWIFSSTLSTAELQACGRERVAPAHGGRLIIACRQDEEKGAGIVLESLPAIQRACPTASLDIVGTGPLLPALRDRARQLKVEASVRFHGRVNHEAVLRLMHDADLFCYPTSASEGFPKVVLEALACGLPVVTTRVSVLPRLLESGCGMLLDDTRPDTLAAGVVRVLGSPSQYHAMSRAALATASGFSLEQWRDTIGRELQAAWGALRAA